MPSSWLKTPSKFKRFFFIWKIKNFAYSYKQGRVRKRPKIWVSYLSKINFLFITKTNNQLFLFGNNYRPDLSIQTKNYEKYHIRKYYY